MEAMLSTHVYLQAKYRSATALLGFAFSLTVYTDHGLLDMQVSNAAVVDRVNLKLCALPMTIHNCIASILTYSQSA